jgi:hypothetical protein
MGTGRTAPKLKLPHFVQSLSKPSLRDYIVSKWHTLHHMLIFLTKKFKENPDNETTYKIRRSHYTSDLGFERQGSHLNFGAYFTDCEGG